MIITLPLDSSFIIALFLVVVFGKSTAPNVPRPLTLLNKCGYFFCNDIYVHSLKNKSYQNIK